MWFLLLLGGFLLLLEAANESDSRRRLESPEKPPPRLLSAVATNITTVDVAPLTAHAQTLCQLVVPLAEEVFTPAVPPGHLKLVFRGAYSTKRLGYAGWHGVDVRYTTDENLNYRHQHAKLFLNGETPAQGPCEEDRAEHQYPYIYESRGGRLAVLLESPLGSPFDREATTGEIQLSVLTLTPSEAAALGCDAHEGQREAEERSRRALELAAAAHFGSNFLREDFQENYARKHTTKITNTLSREWLTEYQRLLSDESLYALVQEQHPHVLPWLEARLEVARIAERVAVEPTPPPPAPESKQRLSREEWEAKIEHHRQRMLDRLSVKAQDQIALMLQKFASAAHLRQRAEEMGLDEDVIERLTQELLGDLDQDEEDHGTRYRQL